MKKTTIRGISINIVLLGIVSFLNDASSEMIMPILPLFIASLGGSGIAIGLVGGVRESISSLLKVICGYLADKTGRRKIFVFSGYFTSSLFKLLLSFSTVWYHILLFSGLERVGKGIRTAPRDAIIADSMPEKRGKGFGIHRALDTSGAILGSIFVFILIWFTAFSFNTILLIAAIIAFFSLIPLIWIRETKRKKQKISFRMGISSLSRPLKLFLVISGIFSLANFSYMFFILKAQIFFTGNWSIAAPVLLYILFNVFYAIFAIPFGSLSDKIGRKTVLISGYLLFSFTAAGFAFLYSSIGFVVLFALYGIVYAILDGNQRALIADLSTEKLRSTALGAYHTVTGIVALPSSMIAGFLWDSISPNTAFLYAAVVSLLAVALFLLYRLPKN